MSTDAITPICPFMNDRAVNTVIVVLVREQLMPIADHRRDGRPQTSTVEYVNVGLSLLSATGCKSHKLVRRTANSRVSVSIRAGVQNKASRASMAVRAHAAHHRDVNHRFGSKLCGTSVHRFPASPFPSHAPQIRAQA
ncbi:hypothetical protein [uncultured Brevundimonas sp.]|uniref:hypothetical protein n=1 Tax=uncultured Brevundimonas sp. TaxID=213418 RepID=UPI0030EC3226|tara:strand:- start:29028 stop:29441 length:414 start_codon:yes stop_codon:yes gene_type:complete